MMKFPTFKKLKQRIKGLSSSQIAFAIMIFLLLVFTISSISVFLAHRGYMSYESQELNHAVGYGIGEGERFLYYEIEIEILYRVWDENSSEFPEFLNCGISIELIDGNSIKIADEQMVLIDPNRVYVCTTRNFDLSIEQLTSDIVMYRIDVTTYHYQPNPVILKLFLVFGINWIICMGVILYERYKIRKNQKQTKEK